MYLSKFVLTFALVAAVVSPLTARADESRCGLVPFRPTQVAPLNLDIPVAHGGVTKRLIGAQVFVPAQPGLSAQWLRANLDLHIADMKQHPMTGCPLSNAGIGLTVANGSTGYWVQISSNDSDTAKLILRQAESLVH